MIAITPHGTAGAEAPERISSFRPLSTALGALQIDNRREASSRRAIPIARAHRGVRLRSALLTRAPVPSFVASLASATATSDGASCNGNEASSGGAADSSWRARRMSPRARASTMRAGTSIRQVNVMPSPDAVVGQHLLGCVGLALLDECCGEGPPWLADVRFNDLTRIRAYTETYTYDPIGNTLRLLHPQPTRWLHPRIHDRGSQQPAAADADRDTVYNYAVDANGNMQSKTTSRHFDWNYANQPKAFGTHTEGTEPSVHAHYLYDATGERVKKLVRKQGGHIEVTHYLERL
jgi:hypothetical protein